MANIKRLHITVEGIVQGIGFRPFIYRIALENNIKGFIYNESRGVIIEAEAKNEALSNFLKVIRESAPPFAKILAIATKEIQTQNSVDFKIIKSQSTGNADTIILPDISICDDCLKDIRQRNNHRYKYPFTNCTNCGPRYSIIKSLPYDREKTSMKTFKMCKKCNAEYTDPLDRRYHAQPNACTDCGPTLELLDSNRSPFSYLSQEEILNKTAELLAKGKIVAIKGLGGFHLACNAADEKSVLRLRERKFRERKPFAVMVPDIETAKKYCMVSAAEETLLTSPQRPIVILKRRKNIESKYNVAPSVAPGNSHLGIMLPYTPLHYLIFDAINSKNQVLVMTSANRTDEPICYRNSEALDRLTNIADYFLIHNRKIHIRTDDSVSRIIDDEPIITRRSRGYAPEPIIIDNKNNSKAQILATGADLKNSICLLKNNKAFISQYIGDIENNLSIKSFNETIAHLKNIYSAQPKIIAHDMHPEYITTKWALNNKNNSLLYPIQHHHAHIASCMAENNLDEKVIGIALDGTGFGTDGKVWGGEILLADYTGFSRTAHLKYIPLPGMDTAIKNPWRILISYLRTIYPDSNPSELKDLSKNLSNIKDSDLNLVLKMIKNNINTVETSSCGRLFDAVSALLDFTGSVSFEGEAAIRLEALAQEYIDSEKNIKTEENLLRYNIEHQNSSININMIPAIIDLIKHLEREVPIRQLAYSFHLTLIQAITEVTCIISRKTGTSRIVLSGGCFQNSILHKNLKKSLERNGLEVYTHSLIPANDGGIAVGQAIIAKKIMEKENVFSGTNANREN